MNLSHKLPFAAVSAGAAYLIHPSGWLAIATALLYLFLPLNQE